LPKISFAQEVVRLPKSKKGVTVSYSGSALVWEEPASPLKGDSSIGWVISGPRSDWQRQEVKASFLFYARDFVRLKMDSGAVRAKPDRATS
jgi:hypothetical protein